MGEVVKFGRRTASIPMYDTRATRERMRRDEVHLALQTLLERTCNDDAGLEMTIVTLHDGLAVDAIINGRTRQRLTQIYPETRIDHFAMVVRGGVAAWRRTLSRRLKMHSIH